jgi:hypothetical protein
MTVYPVLEPGSLVERCQKDIAQFISQERLKSNPNSQDLLTAFSSKEEIREQIEKLKPNFELDSDPKYVDAISHVDDAIKQQRLWIARTYLVYQLLIVLTLSLQNAKLYNEIFLSEATKGILASLDLGDATMFTADFRAEVTAFLNDIKLGIFGSLTPTSDIDIGFQYSGLSEEYVPCLAYIVSRFEMLFLIFTGKSCLDFDIESYADMITVPNPDPDTQGAFPDLFYLDTGKLTWNDETKTKLLPIAFNSIVRNAIIGLGLSAQISLDDVISLFDADISPVPAVPAVPADDSDAGVAGSQSQTYKMKIELVITSLKTDKIAISAFQQSKLTISEFLSKPYNEQIEAYYDAVVAAETLKVTTLQKKTTIDQLRQLTPPEIIDLIVAIGKALTLRIESYTCSPTVVHVVRMLQADAQKIQKKYETSAPKELCDLTIRNLGVARCVVGKAGFILSALEQIGYMYRFHKTYCEGGAHSDTAKCKKKMDKYKIRLDHAIANLRSAQGGGKRVNRRTYMKHTFMKSPSRYNEKPKTKKRRFKTVKKHRAKLYKKYRNSKKMKRAYMKKTVRGI